VPVRNVSQRKGSEVLQAYVGFPQEAAAPPRQLKAARKVTLTGGESRDVVLELDAAAFRYWDERSGAWTRSTSAYRVAVGRSSRDILWEQSLTP
jgi:beta-glucosidase